MRSRERRCGSGSRVPGWYWAAALLFLAGVAGCDPTPDTEPDPPGQAATSSQVRDTNPQVPTANSAALIEGNTAFALELYHQVVTAGGDLVYSPHSLSTALAMTYAGARGETEREMAEALDFRLGQSELHPAFNKLDLDMKASANTFQLHIVNQLWGRLGEVFVPAFLDTLAVNYGAGLRLMDFRGDPEGSRQAINGWVSDATEDRIQNLIPQGKIDDDTVLVLTNAIYFNADWASPFEKESTKDRAFHPLDGEQISVPTMRQTAVFPYVKGDGFAAVDLAYKGNGASMLVIVPDPGRFADVEAKLDPTLLASILSAMESTEVGLDLPKFETQSELPTKDALVALGMKTAFTAAADFSGIRESGGLLITDVIHKAFVKVDEKGTEAAAATAVIAGDTAVPPPPVELRIDRPFIFAIRERTTGALLFAGRVMRP